MRFSIDKFSTNSSFSDLSEVDQLTGADMFATKFAEAAFLACSSLFCFARTLDLLKKLQLARCLLSPRLSDAFSQEQPRAPQDTIEQNNRIQRTPCKNRMSQVSALGILPRVSVRNFKASTLQHR
jgi:hypothetical protein